jgi:hypothetical protein
MTVLLCRPLAALGLLALGLTLTSCASGKVDARTLAIGGLRAQQATDQAIRTTKSLYDQKVIGLPEAEAVTTVTTKIIDAGQVYSRALLTYLATEAMPDGLTAATRYATLLAEFAELVRAATSPGLKAQLTAEVDKAQPSLALTRAALAKIQEN